MRFTQISIVFHGKQNRKFMLDFRGGTISGDGGLLLPEQLARRLGMTKKAGKVFAPGSTPASPARSGISRPTCSASAS